jgi:hypothetical protein
MVAGINYMVRRGQCRTLWHSKIMLTNTFIGNTVVTHSNDHLGRYSMENQ